VRFLESWAILPPLDLIRLVILPAVLALALVLPGRRAARGASLGVAVAVLLAPDFVGGGWRSAAWAALWAAIAWVAGSGPRVRAPSGARGAWLEAGGIGIMLVVVLMVLLVAGVARQGLADETARRASYGLLVLGLGLLHLVVRVNIRRAAVAWGAIGLGLQVLQGAAAASMLHEPPAPPAAVIAAVAIAIALAQRLSSTRLRIGAGARVTDAHDLHD
jgi:hypothetical protein